MENKVYELELNGKTWMLVDSVEYNKTKYFSAVLLDDKKNMTDSYAIFKKVKLGKDDAIDIIRDSREMSEVLDKMMEKISNDMKSTLPEVGSMLELRDREYIVLSYIPYRNNIYMMLITSAAPLDIVIARVEEDMESGEMGIVDVSYMEEGLMVSKIHANIYNNK